MANPHADPSAQGSNASRLLSFLLALLMHVGLGTLLFVGIDWQKPQPEVVQAELWIPMEDLPAPEEAPEAPAPEPERWSRRHRRPCLPRLRNPNP